MNPLGFAKCKQNIMAVYYTLANLDVKLRSKIYQYQLLMLCKDKLVNQDTIDAVLKPLINHLKILESSGVDLGFQEKVLGSCMYSMIGDNLW